MLQQYDELKQRYPDCLMLFRLGDFYELFDADAIEGSRLLNLTLTKRQETPMCGVPHHAAENYIARLTRAGKKVAMCEQLSDPSLPGIVKRDVVRVITPGTTFDTGIIDDKRSHNIIAICADKEGAVGLASADITTGEFFIFDLASHDELADELTRLNPAECIVDQAEKDMPVLLRQYAVMPVFPHALWEQPDVVLKKHFNIQSLDSFGITDKEKPVHAAALLLSYLRETQKSDLRHLRPPRLITVSDVMVIDDIALKNLELITNMHDQSKEGTLLSVLDYTKTAMGGRLMRQWIMHPLHTISGIDERLEALQNFIDDGILASSLSDLLTHVLDIERLLGKLSIGAGNARDLLGIGISLHTLENFMTTLQSAHAPLLGSLLSELKKLDVLKDLAETITSALVDEPPLSTKEGGMIRDGYNNELDEHKKISRDAKTIIAQMQQKEIEATGIQSLKIRFNQIFGYYIEVTKANIAKVPHNYIRKQTTVNGERFITSELKELEEKILTAETCGQEIEYRLFLELRAHINAHIQELQAVAGIFAQLDVLLSLAHVALRNRYTRPVIKNAAEPLMVKDGRHPVIESLRSEHFIPNDVTLNNNRRCVIITGPNMGGKSTYLRQVALIVLMAHIGSFIPAAYGEIPLTDRIFTRVGASDHLVRGQSTFMVEMQETARILHYATPNSLIVLDEIGRGTSTYDGLSLAWSILEYIHTTVGAKMLFATHYHELIAVANTLEHAFNMSVMVQEEKGNIIFLYRVTDGAINRSYGVEVARLAGLPLTVITQAKNILAELEQGVVDKAVTAKARRKKFVSPQLGFF